jgi:hypothetical protein
MEHSQNLQQWAIGVISHWIDNKIKLEEGATLTDIQKTEALIGIHFPESFIELYSKANGFADWDMNINMISVWPLKRIEEEYAINRDKNFVGFSDYLINSHSIGFRKTSAGIFKDYDEFNPIASTFEQGLELINSDSDLIY